MALVASRLTSDISKKGIAKYLNEVCGNFTEDTALSIFTRSDGVKFGWCHNWWHVATMQQTVYRELGIPYFSYRDAIWPYLRTPLDSLTIRWKGDSHPDTYAHSLMGTGVARLISMVCETTCSHPDFDHLTLFDSLPSYTSPEYQLTPEDEVIQAPGCEIPTSTLIDGSLQSKNFNSKWIYGYADVTHHRAAWRIVEETTQEHHIYFEISPGKNNTLMFEYIRSHSFYGYVNVYVETNPSHISSSTTPAFQLATYWERHISIPQWKVYQYTPSKKSRKLLIRPVPVKPLVYIRLSYVSKLQHPPDPKSPQATINYNHTKPLFILYSISSC